MLEFLVPKQVGATSHYNATLVMISGGEIKRAGFSASSLEGLAKEIVEEGFLLRPEETINTIPAPLTSYLYDSYVRAPVSVRELMDFEVMYYHESVKGFGKIAKGSRDCVAVRLPKQDD